ncbi:MAG TPA: hypothetical protein VLH80_07200 [Nitrospiraceae bacterium]|nr:hypothetical protein [Nitrospiraceae bacterium]
MKKAAEIIRSGLSAILLVACLMNFWLALGVVGLILFYAFLRWLFSAEDLTD